jgi:DNA-binding beta-propeller fold protein YncE
VISDDDATVFVLGEDATVRAHAVSGGAEVRKIVVPGKGTGLRLLGGRYLAVLGIPGSTLPIVDTSAWTLVQLEIGGLAVDVALIGRDPRSEPGAAKGEGSHMVAVSGLGRRVTRFALGTWKVEGQVMLPRTITGVVVTRASGREALAVLTQAPRAGELGAIDVFDPAAVPFGGTRLSWAAAVDPRGSAAQRGGDEILIVDRGASQLLRLPHDEPLRIANVGQQPLGAFRLLNRYAVTVDAVGTATVVSLPNLEVRATLALGAVPSDAAVTSDGRALLIALGGGPRQQGALTAVVTGDPPVVSAKIRTGVGAHSVSVSKSDRAAVVTSYWTKTVAVLSRR